MPESPTPAGFSSRRALYVAFVLAALMGWASYRLNRAFGDFLSDEGYLWYGVQRVLAGEIPLRDFMSYEIGRYFLAAAILKPTGADGIIALRGVLGLVGGVSLASSLGLVAVDARETRFWRLIPCAMLFALWLVPRHKVFDIAVSALLVVAVYRLLVSVRVERYFQLGLATGLVAVIGQNHGAYALIASFLAIMLVWYGRLGPIGARPLAAWAAGVMVGYLPVLITAVLARGFLQAEYDALHYILVEYKGTNLPLPVPWPWTLSSGPLTLTRVTLSLFFLAIPMVLLMATVILWRHVRQNLRREEMLFAASWTVALPYANVAFSRADAMHLAQAMLPLLLLLLGFGGMMRWSPRARLVLAGTLLAVSLPLVIPMQPRAALLNDSHLVTVDIHGDHVVTDIGKQRMLDWAKREHRRGTVLAVPFYPGMSAVLGERSPTWEIYPLFPRGPRFEQAEIARIERVRPVMVMLSRAPLDRRPELAYPVTHPLLFEYIVTHYRPVPASGMPLDIYERTEDVPAPSGIAMPQQTM